MIIPASFIEKYGINNAIVCDPSGLPQVSGILMNLRKGVADKLLSKVFPFINNNSIGLKYNIKCPTIEDSLFMSDLISLDDESRDKDIEYALDNSLNLYSNGRMFIFKLDNSDDPLAHSYYINEYNMSADINNLREHHMISIFVDSSGLDTDKGEDISFVYDILEARFMGELSKYIPLTRICKYYDKHICYWLHNPKSAVIIDLEYVEPSAIVFIAAYYVNLFAGIMDILDVDFNTFYDTMINKEGSGFNLSIIHKSQMKFIWDEVSSAEDYINIQKICDKLYEDFCLRRVE